MQPALFLPHGAPDLALSDIPAAQFLRGFFEDRPKPRGIVIISAHWEAPDLQVTTAAQLDTIYDFGGFGSALHKLRYPAETAPWLIELTQTALDVAGHAVSKNPIRGLDHGAWIPLLLMLPKAELPVVQVSLPKKASPEELFRIGQGLATLADHDVLVIGSGATVHNLRRVSYEGSAIPDWAAGFDDWLETVLLDKDWPALCQFQTTKFGRISHPSTEHLKPLFVISGICDARQVSLMHSLHRSYSYGSIGMAAWEVRNAF